MAEYIEREGIFNKKVEVPLFGKMVEMVAVSEIERIPAADVRPVVRGKWVQIGGKYSRDKMIDRRILTCSVCGSFICMEGVNAGRGDANFCPNCGAKMEVGNHGNG